MIGYSGRSADLINAENKPISRGYQRLCLADKSGYSCTWDYYRPKLGMVQAPKLPELGRKASAVPFLVRQLPNQETQEYHLFLDNFFTSRHLVCYLRELPFPVGCSGTSKPNAGHPQATLDTLARLGRQKRILWGSSTGFACADHPGHVPKRLVPDTGSQSEVTSIGSSPTLVMDYMSHVKHDSPDRNSSPADLPVRTRPKPRFIQNSHLCNSITWVDQKVTLWMTSVYEHDLGTGLQTRLASHAHGVNPSIDYSVAFGPDRRREVLLPIIVDDYNHYMGGVDLGNQYRAELTVNGRFDRIWRPLALDLLKIMTKNAWILYRKEPNTRDLTFKGFRTKLLIEIKEHYTLFGRAHTRKAHKYRGQEIQTPIPEARRCLIGWNRLTKRRQCSACSANRLDRVRLAELSANQRRKRPSLTSFCCQDCRVALCHKEVCWQSWHGRKYLPN